MRELVLGGGSRTQKLLPLGAEYPQFEDPIFLDSNPAHEPTLVWDLNRLPLPFPDHSFDEIHAYHVLEHTGKQGDWQFFFAQFNDFYRVLKPRGKIHAMVPMWNSVWAWGDPSHTRVINIGTLAFLSQENYRKQVGVTPMSDFRFCYSGDFEVTWFREDKDIFSFTLFAI